MRDKSDDRDVHHGATGAGQQGGELPGVGVIEEPDGGQGSVDDHGQDEDHHQSYLNTKNIISSLSSIASLTMTRMRPLPAAILLSLTCDGKEGSIMPVMGFFSRYGALAAK